MYKIADLHSDILSQSLNARNSQRLMSADLICTAVFTKNGDYDFEWQVLRYNDLKKDKNILLCFENLHFINRVDFTYFLSLKPFYAGLTWNGENCLAGEKGITEYGKSIVKNLQDNDILIDTAHLNLKAFYDLIDIIRKPIINSHTCMRGLQQHERNVTDEQIKLILESGGIVGLTFVKPFLSDEKNCGVDDIVRHIDYFCCKFDYKKLCLASDYAGSINIPSKIKNYKMWVNLVGKLSKIGYNENVIEKIFYYNFHDFKLKQRR